MALGRVMEGLHDFQVPLSHVPLIALTSFYAVGMVLVLGDISWFLSKLPEIGKQMLE